MSDERYIKRFMENAESKNDASLHLYPATEPFRRQIMDVPGGHKIYFEQCGNPDGIPVVVLHGGPGGGCSPAMRRFFNPEKYHVILFDQRGCGRSTPHAETKNNTTWDLVADIERIRCALQIDNWIVFGGSWGATLSLIYAQAHSDRVLYLVLRGVFLMTQAELDWFYGGGAGVFWPEEWAKFTDAIPIDEQGDLIAAYHKRLFCDDERLQVKFARLWTEWENSLAVLEPRFHGGTTPAAYARAFSRIENHYFINKGFLTFDGQILKDMGKISHIPGTIVQGRYDMICPPKRAYEIHALWPASQLRIVKTAGHAMSEPGIAHELVSILDDYCHPFENNS